MDGLSHYETDRLSLDINVSPEIVTVTITVKELDYSSEIFELSDDGWLFVPGFTKSFTAPNKSQRRAVLGEQTETDSEVLRRVAVQLETEKPLEVI